MVSRGLLRVKRPGPFSLSLVRVFVGLSMAVCEAKVLRRWVTRWTVGFHLAVLGVSEGQVGWERGGGHHRGVRGSATILDCLGG